MIVACPNCASPFQIPADQIAPLVQIACPSCGFAMILDFEAANDPSLREPGVQTTSAYRSAGDYYSAVGQAPARQASTTPPAAAQPAAAQPAPAQQPAAPAAAAAPAQPAPAQPAAQAPAQPARPSAPAQPPAQAKPAAPARPAAPAQPPAQPATQAKPAAPSRPPSGPQRSAKPAQPPPTRSTPPTRAQPSSQVTQAVQSVPAAAAAAAQAQQSQAAPPKGRGVPKKTMIGVAPPRPTPPPQPTADLDDDIPTQVKGFDLSDLDQPTSVRPPKEEPIPLTGDDEGPTVVRAPSGQQAPAARTPPHTPPNETASRQPDEKDAPEAVDPAAQSQPAAPVKKADASPDVPPETGGGRRTLLLLLVLLLIGVGGLVGLSWQDDGDPNPIPYVQKLIDKYL